MTPHIKVFSPSGRTFELQRHHGALVYTVTEPDGRTIPVDTLTPAETKQLMQADLALEEKALAAGIMTGHSFAPMSAVA